MSTEVMKFESWEDMLKSAVSGAPTTSRRESRGTSRNSWYGSETFEEAVILARHGWPDGLARMTAQVRIAQDQLPTNRILQETFMAPVGPGTLDMGRFVQGHPEPWISFRNSEERTELGNIITINVNASMSAEITDELFARGARVVALINVLEKLGHHVELNMVNYISYYNDDYSLIRTTVKRTNEPIDLERIAFMSAHNSFLRRILFSILEQFKSQPAIDAVDRGNYGSAAYYSEPGAINIAAPSRYDNRIEITDWLNEILKSVGIESMLEKISEVIELPAPSSYQWDIDFDDSSPDSPLETDGGDEEDEEFNGEEEDEEFEGEDEDGEDESGDEDGDDLSNDEDEEDDDEGVEQSVPEMAPAQFCCLRCAWIAEVQAIVNEGVV